MINMTVYTIIYNNYGQFLKNWLSFVKRQTLPAKEILVILGKNHGVDKSKYENVRFIECDSDVMGTLRNVAIKNKRYKKCLYFSVDDELHKNALMDIEKKFHQGYQVVGLKFNDYKVIATKTDVKGQVSDICIGIERNSFLAENPKKWRQCVVPGWVAVNGSVEYEDIEIPNYPYLFKLKSLELPMAQTDTVVATYKRRKGSHGDISKTEGKFKQFASEIDKWVIHYGD